ncbi:MAG: BMP family ABC transporter substrate-binding protein [Eubacteriales bacterium]|jgi:basic membrane protein A|nr:BMP family ABC transporter substrate-binding protein [Eubacteriales bacterium]MDD4104279.1 BMP family ABC transporter substrate-binding protein [Eubacteriales bacterium]MDD4709774.1 BMP family ABC transporter substrate-binding protein [Eubacteriales bacterium]NLO14438.1 BMP family ABC transporter substrate-binding protein [Clostridiales bacterium]
MFKKMLAFILSTVLFLSLVPVQAEASFPPVAKEDIKVGAIFIGPKDDGFTGAHYNGVEGMKEALGLNDDQILYKFNVPENNETDIALRELIDAGCQIIFGNSWGYMDFMMEIADEYPEVIFSHCSGYKNNGVNFNNYFGRIYQSRYLAGIAAGLKTQTNLIGYVAAWPDNAEVNGGINAYALGIQSVNPEAKVYVKYINSWGNPSLEKQTAVALLDLGCDVIGQHVDSAMPQVAAQEAGKFGNGYNTDMTSVAPDAHLTAPIWNWSSVYTAQVQAVIDGVWEPVNYFLGLKENMVDISPLSKNVAEGTQEKIDEARTKIVSGEWDVFTGPLFNNAGEQVLAENETFADGDITGGLMTTLLVDGVEVK